MDNCIPISSYLPIYCLSSVCLCWPFCCQLDTRLGHLRNNKLVLEDAYITLPCRQVCGTFSYLMINAGGPSVMMVITFLYKQP